MVDHQLVTNMMFIVLSVLLIAVCFSYAEIAFDETPADTTVVFGQDLFLSCSARNLTTDSKDGLRILWKLNDLDIQPKASVFSNGTLLVPLINNDDLGNYTCSVFDSADNMVLTSPPASVFHAYIKMFEVSPIPVNALEDEVVSFDCITGESAPAPEIFWERNGSPFSGGEQYSATYGGYSEHSLIVQYSMKLILRAKPHIDGSYNCVARNPVLKIDVRSRRVLMQTAEIESPPYIMDDAFDTNVTAPLNQPLLLDCPILGKPQVEITWFKDNSPVNEVGDFFILINGSLHRPSTQESDEGLYICEGTNPLGFVSSPGIYVTIARIEVEFVEEPEDLFVIAGLSATLRCAPPLSVPVASVTWYKDNALLVPRTGDQAVQIVKTVHGYWNVQFKEIQKRDEGEYFCVATNTHAVPQSRTSRSAVISVGGAPIFVEPPVGLTIEKGKLAQLSCYVQGDPFPEVTWLFENEVLSVSETVSYRHGNQELWIGNVNKGNEGTYTCRAVNRYSTIQTRVYLKVLVPPVVIESVGHTVVSKGESVIIPCGIYSDPDPTITWYKDSSAISVGDRFTLLHNGLYITAVDVEDSGTYLCHAANLAGYTENSGTLEVLVKPHFIEKPKDQTVNIGRNVTLTCIASGFPKPQLTWLYNDSSLFPPDTLLSLNKEQLVLLEVGWMHVGKYSCIAQNDEGSEESEAVVTLRVPPKVLKLEGVPLLYEGENLQLTCHINGIPAPSVEWYFRRQLIVPSTSGRISFPEPSILVVKFVTLEDEGVYSCKAISTAGVSQRDVQIYIITHPSAPVLHKAETVSATSVLLSWSIEQLQPQTPVDHVVISHRKQIENASPYLRTEVKSDTVEYLVDDLDPASDYIFMLTAVNAAGTSDISNILSARTYDAGPSEPRNLQVRDVSAYNITVGWEIPQTTNGDIKRYQLIFRERNQLQDRAIIINSDGHPYHEFHITSLTPYTRYILQVRAATMEGDQVLWGNWSDTVHVKTSQAAPTGGPRDVKAKSISPYIVQVTWEAVAQQEQNGPIKRYYVKYWLQRNLSTSLGEETIDSLDLQTNITDLDPWTWYMVKVIPENSAGQGEASEPVSVRTLPTAPGSVPLNLTAEAQSASSILVKWQVRQKVFDLLSSNLEDGLISSPPDVDWHSDLAGFVIQFWKLTDSTISQVLSLGALDLAAIISDLDPYTEYGLRVAAFTDQVTDGMGPFTDNMTVQTAQSEPGHVVNLDYTATSTTINLSWKPPENPNGVISHYLILYHVISKAVVTTPTLQSLPLIREHLSVLLNSSHLMNTVFVNFDTRLTEETLTPLTSVCDAVMYNKTVFEDMENVTDILQSNEVTHMANVSNKSIFEWMSREQVKLGNLCLQLQSVLIEILRSNDEGEKIVSVFNVTTLDLAVTLSGLQSNCIYNISVLAATVAGYGQVVTLQAVTLASPVTEGTSRLPDVSVTKRPVTEGDTSLQREEEPESLNLPVIIGGAVSGFILLVILMLIGGCICMKRRQTQSEEKSKVVNHESLDNTIGSSMYGQLDRPRPAAVALAADDGTDSVDIYSDEVRFQSPQHHYKQSSDRSFMTEESGEISHRQHISDVFLGMDNPSYAGLAAPATIKSNPAYYEEPSSSDLESMTVTMAFPPEDNSHSTAGESTLKRKSKMKSVDAAAIARLRNSALPEGLSDTDKSSLINNEVEVVYNERTAL